MAEITALITDRDNSEVVRDRIAEILLVELANQRVLAPLAEPPQSPDLWNLRIFTERTNPWEEFADDAKDEDSDDDAPVFVRPIVNVWYDNSAFDARKSDTMLRQTAVGVFNIDCYGFGISENLPGGGHAPGDAKAVLQAQRATRLVRKILMNSAYAWLGLPRGEDQFIWGRRVNSVQSFQAASERASFHVAALRIAFEVTFNEFSAPYQATTIEEIGVAMTRAETGEVSLTFQVGESPTP